MTSDRNDFNLKTKQIDGWDVPMLELPGADRLLSTLVVGTIANSVPTSQTGRDTLAKWKVQIASAAKNARGQDAWNPANNFAITLALRFCPALHGYRALDVENFVKPIIDALAAGLFCHPETEPSTIQHFNFDDSNFNTLLIHRLSDARSTQDEGAAIFVSSRRS